MSKILRGYLFVVFFFLGASLSFAIPSQNDFYSVGSDFIALQNPENTIPALPQIYTLYPNTLVSLDINNDGAYDYTFQLSRGGPFFFNTSWQIIDGTKIHSNKPIQYVQQIYVSTQGFQNLIFKDDTHTTVPPISNFKNEYILRNGTWYVLSDLTQNVSVDTSCDGTVDSTFFLNKTTKTLTITKFTHIFSDRNFIAYSSGGLAGVLSKDFTSNENKAYIIVPQNNTHVTFDYNFDGTPDADFILNTGEYNFNIPKPSRITSDKVISAFGTDIPTGFNIKSYFPFPMTDSLSNELMVGVNNDFQTAQDKGHSLIGVFNSDSAPNMNFDFQIFDSTLRKTGNYFNFTNGKTQTLGAVNGGFFVNSSLPVVDSAYYFYNLGMTVRYYIGHTAAYKSIYLTTSPKTKSILKNSDAIINLRVFNPFNDTTVNGIVVKFPVNNEFSMPVASVNGRKASLADDSVISTFSKAVTLANDGNETYFTFTYDDVLEPGNYLDIDFSLSTPSSDGTVLFSPATLTYNSPTWII